jgi:hypothetical protein
MDYKLWMDNAKSKIETLSNGQIFVLKDLFCGTDWEALKVGDRLSLGKYFKNAVLEKEFLNVTYLGKADNNSAKYQKTEEN